MRLFEKKAVCAKTLSFNNPYIARIKEDETGIYCRSILGLQSPTLNFYDLIQSNRKFCKIILTPLWPTWIGHEHDILLPLKKL